MNRGAVRVPWAPGDELRAGRVVGRCNVVEPGLGNAYVADGLVVEFVHPDLTTPDPRGVYFDRHARLFRVVPVLR